MAALNLLWSDSDQGYPPPEVLHERWEAAKQALLDRQMSVGKGSILRKAGPLALLLEGPQGLDGKGAASKATS